MKRKKLVVFSGAGISAESGVKTFRDSNGLWEDHRIEDVASPEGFARNPQFVLDFYNARRRQLNLVEPNDAHQILAELQEMLEVVIITQNVDDLHEKAGSKNVIHLHGELKKARPINSLTNIIDWNNDLNIGDLAEDGTQLRPHIVWFGEMVPEMERAAESAKDADFLLIVGTSLQVYPAAGIVDYVPGSCEIFGIDLNADSRLSAGGTFFNTSATEGMRLFKDILMKKL